MKTEPLDMMRIMAKHTIQIKMTKYKQFKIRSLIGLKMLKLGAWIAGCKLEIKTDAE